MNNQASTVGPFCEHCGTEGFRLINGRCDGCREHLHNPLRLQVLDFLRRGPETYLRLEDECDWQTPQQLREVLTELEQESQIIKIPLPRYPIPGFHLYGLPEVAP